MKSFVFLFFIPGSAGNFFSRCLNLLDKFYAYDNGSLPLTVDDKLKMLSYTKVKNFREDGIDWTDFEKDVNYVLQTYEHNDINVFPPGSFIVLATHPESIESTITNFSQLGDKIFFLMIDGHDIFDWVLLNAIHKHSYLGEEWMVQNEIIRNDPRYFKINLKNVITSEHTFIKEFKKVCEYLKVIPSEQELSTVTILYKQWKATTIELDELDRYKKVLGISEVFLPRSA